MNDTPEETPPLAASSASVELDAPARRLWPGILVWLVVCAAYVGIEHAGLVDGLALPVPLIALLVVARAVDARPRRRHVARRLALVGAAVAVAVALVVWRHGIAIPGFPALELGALLLAAAAAVALASPRRLRVLLFRPLGLDPDSAVHVVAAFAAAVTIAVSALLFAELQGVGEETIPFYPSDSLVSVLSDGALALAGIGFLLTRGGREAQARLDLNPIRWRQALVAATLAAAFLVLVGVMEHLEGVWLPHVQALEERFDYEFVGMPPWVGAILLSLAAGVGEELVFRGALQPRLGVFVTSLLFASVHVQYQVPGMLMIFLIAVGLGLIKQRTSTTFTVCVHVFYDLGAFFLP